MTHTVRLGALITALGTMLPLQSAAAAVAQHEFYSNAINYCQAFTPGPSNTIRNRVVGSENIGATMAVACNFHSVLNGASGNTPPTGITIFFSNNRASGSLTVTCSLLTGYQGQSNAYIVTKTTVAIPAGSNATHALSWTASDNPTPGATSLGNRLVGINCTLPTGAVMNDVSVRWNQDNGV